MKYVQAWWGDLSRMTDLHHHCMGTVKSFAEDYEFRRFPDIANPQAASDALRYDMSRFEPDSVYLDCDMELFKPIDDLIETTNKPLMDHIERQPHGALLIVNNCCEWFVELEKERIKRGIKRTTNGFFTKLLRRKYEHIDQVPDEYFKHHFITSHSDEAGPGGFVTRKEVPNENQD